MISSDSHGCVRSGPACTLTRGMGRTMQGKLDQRCSFLRRGHSFRRRESLRSKRSGVLWCGKVLSLRLWNRRLWERFSRIPLGDQQGGCPLIGQLRILYRFNYTENEVRGPKKSLMLPVTSVIPYSKPSSYNRSWASWSQTAKSKRLQKTTTKGNALNVLGKQYCFPLQMRLC